eukprot:5288087-Pyramimonas_sp.AAC.1
MPPLDSSPSTRILSAPSAVALCTAEHLCDVRILLRSTLAIRYVAASFACPRGSSTCSRGDRNNVADELG